ncbi:WD repeat-containing protein 90 isoform X2 [Poeciliopsis prolifica]|uniref:WD repeat-containing protein 90 isoform X2 n=1 Tax=Poeciliopsis prolifica TaxID=188132 RepID=UPI002414521B|nr:WD repeat-containing protein 90 isoform X2 [Poeciliopsis prolifica]
MASTGWQNPYVNIFKHVKVEEWRRSAKAGDVSSSMDRTLRCPVFLIKGPVPTNSYILVPKSSNQTLGLTGRYFYLLFRPTPGKYFMVHLDVAVEEGQAVRISFSNMFKEFKSTATWLQFPFLCGAAKDSVYEKTSRSARQGLVGPAPASARWTCLMIDLCSTLSFYLNRHYTHLKSVKLCANMAVKNMFTSDLLLDPAMTFNEAKLRGLSSSRGTGPIPREMSFPVPKGGFWNDFYDHIKFPSDGTKLPFDSIQKPDPAAGTPSCQKNEPGAARISGPVQHRVSICQPIDASKLLPRNRTSVLSSVPELSPSDSMEGDGPLSRDAGVHVYARPQVALRPHGGSSGDEVFCASESLPVASVKESEQQLLPDPILRLSRIIGFGGATAGDALWSQSGEEVVYPCHAIIVSMKILSREQRFFIGHTDKISALTFNGSTTVLASAQRGSNSVVRLWDYSAGTCLSMFRAHAHSLSCLSFSYGGGILCGVGKDRHNKTMVVVWNTLNASKGGEGTILAKAHTDVDIATMKVTFFDDTRMVSCGRENVRLWRVRNGLLRSCPVCLGDFHSLDFTDVAFQQGDASDQPVDHRTLFASTRSGHILEIDYSRVMVRNARRLLPAQQQHAERREKWTFNTGPGIPINSISVSSSFCATGTEDGFLRLWTLDFSAVILEAEHEGPVAVVSVSFDNQQVLAATFSGNLGYLDVSSRAYNTLMRSHTDEVLGFSVDGIRRHLTTASADGTVRVWDKDSLQQLYDFVSMDNPRSVAFHPHESTFACGFSSGTVRVFDISSARLLAEHKKHRGEVIGLAFSPDGDLMYSADSEGSLALHDASEEDHSVIRVTCNVVAQGTERAPDALAVSGDSSRLAFVGPTPHIITVADARSLNELLHVDISVLDAEGPDLDAALKVRFSPASAEHLLVATSANKILWISTKTGRLLRQVSNVHRRPCSSLAVSEDSRFLLTSGHNTVKVWDYKRTNQVKPQMYIGHSQPIRQVSFTPDQLGVVSVGDAIFLWDFLAEPDECLIGRRSPGRASYFSWTADGEANAAQLSGGMPRQEAPLPSSQQQLDVSAMDPEIQEDLGHLSVCDDDPAKPVQPTGPSQIPDHRPVVSFLKVTDLDSASPVESDEPDTTELDQNKPDHPNCYKHFTPRLKTLSLDQSVSTPRPQDGGIKLKAVIGYNGNGRGNMGWSPDQGLFAYSCGGLVVLEHLHTGTQSHLQGHSEEISCLAISNDAQTLVSAAGSSRSLVSVWDVQTATCRGTASHHKGAVQSLAFSRDDLFFLSVGDFSDPVLALWSSASVQLLCSVSMSAPVHDAAFSPAAAGQLACVGSEGIHFCLIHTRATDIEACRVSAPPEVGDVELTALCYHLDSFLLTSTAGGHVCAWDVNKQRCFMVWKADEGEIGVLLCRENRLLTGGATGRLQLWQIEVVQGVKFAETTCSMNDVSKVVVEQEVVLDGKLVSGAFDNFMDMGIVGTTAGTLWYINWSDSSIIRLVSGHRAKVNDVVFSHDESRFATCSQDGSVRVWSTGSLELVVQFQVINQACGCLSWSPLSSSDGSRIAAGYGDGTLRIFQLTSTEMEMKLRPHQEAITAITYSASGHVILSAGSKGLVAVSSPISGVTIRVIRDHKGAAINSIQSVSEQCKRFGLEGNEMVLVAGADRRVSVWATNWFKEKCDLLDWLSFPAPPSSEEDSLPPCLAAFYPADHSLLLYTGYGLEKELSFYSLTKKQIIKKISLTHWATCISLSPRGHLLAVGCKERVLKLIKSTSGRFQDFLQHSDALQTCRFSPSGSLLFSTAYDEVLLWAVPGL